MFTSGCPLCEHFPSTVTIGKAENVRDVPPVDLVSEETPVNSNFWAQYIMLELIKLYQQS